MPLVATAGGWILLALLVALAAHVAAAIGYLYGLLARRLSGSPVFRDLFISRAAVTAYNDAALTALLVARREQKRYYTRLLVRLSFIGPVELVLLGLFFDGFSLPLAATLAIALALLEFSALRRLQHYTDDRAAETVGAAELANAFERVAVEGGVTVKETPSRNWFSSSPSLSARIERLRAEAGTTADGAGATGGGTASAGDRSPTRGR